EAAERVTRAGLALPPELAAPRVRLEVAGGSAKASLQRLALDPAEGRYVAQELEGLTLGAPVALPPGRYLAQVAWGDAPSRRVPVPFVARRGPPQALAVPRPALLARRWGWAEFAYVHPGRTYGGNGGDSQVLDVPVEVAGFYAGRTEVLLEGWYAYRCALGWPPAAQVPTGNKRARADGPLSPGLGRLPVARVSADEVGRYLGWLRAELLRARVPLLLGLPTAEMYARALRGPFRWLFPWGEAFDASFVAPEGALSPARSGPQDRSVFGVYDLVSSVAEFNKPASHLPVGTFSYTGGSFRETWSNIVFSVTGVGLAPRDYRHDLLGFRVYALEGVLPELERDPARCAARRAEALRLAGLTDYLGAIREATAAIDADPLDLEAWLIRGTARLRLSDNWGANFDGCRAVELDPESVDGWSLIALAEDQRGLHASSLEAWDRALALRPRMADSYRMRAHVKAALDDRAGALEDLDQYERLAPAQHPMRDDADRLRAELGD
ncbi:MAG: hypothetical protein KDD82_08360, partial [Planctomycetes bacterium]|nr:hypothetical protein [Planctomycetota bacterium]